MTTTTWRGCRRRLLLHSAATDEHGWAWARKERQRVTEQEKRKQCFSRWRARREHSSFRERGAAGAKKSKKTMTGAVPPPVLVLDNGGHTVKLGVGGRPDPSM
jgi:hypothetical protein